MMVAGNEEAAWIYSCVARSLHRIGVQMPCAAWLTTSVRSDVLISDTIQAAHQF